MQTKFSHCVERLLYIRKCYASRSWAVPSYSDIRRHRLGLHLFDFSGVLWLLPSSNTDVTCVDTPRGRCQCLRSIHTDKLQLKSADTEIRSGTFPHIETPTSGVSHHWGAFEQGTAAPAVSPSILVNNLQTHSVFHFPDHRKMRAWALPWQPTTQPTHRPTRPVVTHTHAHAHSPAGAMRGWKGEKFKCFYMLTRLVNAKSVTVCVCVSYKIKVTGGLPQSQLLHFSFVSLSRSAADRLKKLRERENGGGVWKYIDDKRVERAQKQIWGLLTTLRVWLWERTATDL